MPTFPSERPSEWSLPKPKRGTIEGAVMWAILITLCIGAIAGAIMLLRLIGWR